MMFNNRASALLSFESVNKLLYVYTESEGITSYYLDGSSSMTIDINFVEFFTVDGRNNVIYYHNQLFDRIWIFNMTSGKYIAEDDLADVPSVKDLDMDLINGYLCSFTSINLVWITYVYSIDQLRNLVTAP